MDFKCFVDLFLEISEENPEEFSKEDVINEVCTFFLAVGYKDL